MRAKTALTILIYKKVLRLSKNSFEKTSVGQILNILANDMQRLDDLGFLAPYYYCSPLQAIIVIYVMWKYYLGIACLGGAVLMILFIPFQAVMGRMFNKFRY